MWYVMLGVKHLLGAPPVLAERLALLRFLLI